MRPVQRGGFPGQGSAGSAAVLPGGSARFPVGIVHDDHAGSRPTCQFASCRAASKEDDGLRPEHHAALVTSPQVPLG